MRQVGVTTVQRWLSEPLREGIRAYMQSGEKLYEVRTVTGCAGVMGASLLDPLCRGLPFAGDGPYTLQSPVYLYWGKEDLGGLEVDSIVLAELGITAITGGGSGWVGVAAPESAYTGPQQGEAGLAMVRAVSLSTPCHPHCG